ncbi:UDP-4-amino-4-deoxy-L-arabinose--oxoglutarate aminotransferase [Thalassocella blandensis]|nr:UDP-4-amino-4-deoxy-L-arabinose--oxoglutarate aminotransferase [Thalassocella blandensis]
METLRSGWLTQGPQVGAFEQALAAYGGADHAIALSNGTAALHAACMALGLGTKGLGGTNGLGAKESDPDDRRDIVWTSPISFVASANCARYCGADIDFVDIDPSTRLMSIEKLKQKLQLAAQQNRLPKILIPVHYAGLPCDMPAIAALAAQYNFHVIEDAAHAIGSRYGESRVGDCRYSDMVIYSFHPVKTMTTGEGGAVLTNSQTLSDRIRQFITHGITRDAQKLENNADEPWYYEQQLLGVNYRLSDLHATLGLSQLKRVNEFIEKRRQLFERYHEILADLPLTLPREQALTQSAWHLFAVALQGDQDIPQKRRRVFDFLRQHNIGVNVHYIPIHLQPDFKRLGFSVGDFPMSEDYYQRTMSLPLFPDLTFEEQDYIADKLREALT